MKLYRIPFTVLANGSEGLLHAYKGRYFWEYVAVFDNGKVVTFNLEEEDFGNNNRSRVATAVSKAKNLIQESRFPERRGADFNVLRAMLSQIADGMYEEWLAYSNEVSFKEKLENDRSLERFD